MKSYIPKSILYIIHRAIIFVTIFATVFSPFVSIFTLYLPKKIAQIIPITNVAYATSLPTLTPNGEGTDDSGFLRTEVVGEFCSTGGVDCYLKWDEGIAGADDDTSYIVNTGSSLNKKQGATLTDTPSNFGSMDTVTVDVRSKVSGTRDNDNVTLTAQIFESGGTGAAALTNEVTVCEYNGSTNTCGTSSYVTNTVALTLQGNNNKTVWDGAELVLSFSIDKAQADDGLFLRATAAEVDGTYTIAAATINISGTCKQSDQSTNCTQGSKIAKVAVNGTIQAQTDTTVASGVWSITGVAEPSVNDIITVFIDNEGASTSQAVAVTKWTSGNITGVELIEGHLSIGSNQWNTITNANLSQYDNSVSGKMTFHDVNGSTLTVDPDNVFSGEELYVKGGNTYQPDSTGGDTVNTHDIEINGTFDLDTNVVAASGSWDNNGLFIANTGSVSFTGIGSETISNTASAGYGSHFYHLKIDSPNNGGTLTLNDVDVVASGQVSIGTGDTLSISSAKKLTHAGATLVLNGTISGAGKFVYRSATAFPTSGTVSSILVFDAQDGNQTMSARTYGGQVEIANNSTSASRTVIMGAGTPYTFSSNLYVIASSSQNITLAGATNDPAVVDIAGDLDFTGTGAGSEVITSGTGDWQVAGNVNFTDGTFTTESGNTLTMDVSGTLTSNAQTLQNLTLSGTVTLANATHTVAGNLNMAGGTITAGSSTVTMSGTVNTITGGGNILSSLTIDPSSAGTITMQTSNLTVSGTLTVAASDKFKIESGRTLTLSGTGTPLSVSGTFEPDDGSTVQYTGSATVTGTTFGNLTLGDGADTITLPSTGTPTIKGNLSINSAATVASGSATILFRAGGSQSVTDNTTNKQNLGEIAVRSSTSGNTTLTLGSSIRIASATIDSSQTLDANGANTITISSISSPFTVNGIFAPRTGTVKYTGVTANVTPTKYASLSLGGLGTYTLPSTGTTTLLGNLLIANGATVASGSSTLFFRKGGSQSITDNTTTKQNLGEIAIQASTSNTTLTLGSSIRIASATVDASQTLDANGSNTITVSSVSSPFTVNGTFNRSTGIVVFTGAGATNIPALNYYDLKVQPSANSATHTFLSGTASVSKTFTVGNGTNTSVNVTADTNGTGLDVASVSISANTTLVADNSSEFTVARHFRNNGSFTHSSGTVTFDGPNTSSVSGATTFNNFTSTKAGKKIKFGAGQIFTFAGTFTITGAVGNLIKIESTASASQWLPHFNGAQSGVTYAQITDSGCDTGTATVTLDSTSSDGGNNGSCWDFPGGGTTYTQNDYQWYSNDNSVQPSGALDGVNTQATITNRSNPVRLRMSITIGDNTLDIGEFSGKLQWANSTSGPWADVAATTSNDIWKFYNNTSATSGADITTNLLAASDVRGTYQEGNPTPANPRGASVGNDVEWDFALDPRNTMLGSVYYFRMVKSDGTVLDTYDNYPAIRTGIAFGIDQSAPSNQGFSGSNGRSTGGGQGGDSGGSQGGGSGSGGSAGGGGAGGGGGGGSPVMFELLWLRF